MTRQEAIERWTVICSTVFWAEENIAKEWHERLKSAHTLMEKERHELAGAYLQAVATEIVSNTTDEELAKWNY